MIPTGDGFTLRWSCAEWGEWTTSQDGSCTEVKMPLNFVFREMNTRSRILNPIRIVSPCGMLWKLHSEHTEHL